MYISILSIGKFENSPHKLVYENYLKRLKWKIELKELDLRSSNNLSIEKLKELEGELIVLDEKGKQFSSRDFAKLLSESASNGDSNLTFAIGGSNGLSQEVLKKAHLKISFGLMTFPHLMVRSILAEQLYRAFTINNNHPYHKD